MGADHAATILETFQKQRDQYETLVFNNKDYTKKNCSLEELNIYIHYSL